MFFKASRFSTTVGLPATVVPDQPKRLKSRRKAVITKSGFPQLGYTHTHALNSTKLRPVQAGQLHNLRGHIVISVGAALSFSPRPAAPLGPSRAAWKEKGAKGKVTHSGV